MLAGRSALAAMTLAVVLSGAASATRQAHAASAAIALTRGPYLQRMNAHGVVVRWRTSVPTSSWAAVGDTCGAWLKTATDLAPTTEHELAFDSLSAATHYVYAVGDSDSTLTPCGDAYAFRTAPEPGTPAPTRLWVIGDSGSNSALGSAVRDAWQSWSIAHPADLWLMLGDNAYGAGTDLEYQSGLFGQYPQMLRTTGLYTTRGNHDVLYAGAGNDYYDFFTLPAYGESGGVVSGSEAYYAFDWANVHFVCLDSEGSSALPSSPMSQWLRADLASTTQPWVIAFWHHPPYTKGSHDSDNALDSGGRMRDMRQWIVPMLDSLGCDLVLTGHSHSYERSCLLAGHYGVSSTLAPSMRVDAGDGREGGNGAYEKPTLPQGAQEGIVYAVNGSAAQISGGTLNHPAMVTSLNVGGSMVIDVIEHRLEARFLDSFGVVRDSFVVLKGAFTSAPRPAVSSLRLAPPVPQPGRGEVRLGFTLPSAGVARLDVLDAQGRRVAVLLDGPRAAGDHMAYWSGRDARGRALRGGVYYAVLNSGGERRVQRLVHLPN